MNENNLEKKYYTNHNGEQIEISSMNTEHILNALGKKQREIFNKLSKDEVAKELQEIDDLKQEYHKRLNEWYSKLEK